jgi:hypothetical protein
MPDDRGAIIDAYEFFLSPRSDLAWPVLASHHSVIYSRRPQYAPPTADAFIDGETYYWRVRARSADGVWGPWSGTWTFVARGPAPVRDPEAAFGRDTGRATLSWQPPDYGQPIARYEVYASDAPGFTPLRHPRESSTVALKPSPVTLAANLVGETTETSFDVTGRPEPFYRVVAVDEAGSRSQPTACVALPHPALGGLRPMTTVAGRPFEAKVPVIRSVGLPMTDVKRPPRWGADTFSLRLRDAPDWLALDVDSGVLRGTPPVHAAGEHGIVVELTVDEQPALLREYTVVVRLPDA